VHSSKFEHNYGSHLKNTLKSHLSETVQRYKIFCS